MWTDQKNHHAIIITRQMGAFLTPAAIDRLFDRAQASLPQYISAMPSLVVSLIVTLSIALIGVCVAMVDRGATTEHKNVLVRFRWTLVIIGATVLGFVVGDVVQSKYYTIQCISKNRQHFANVHWLRLYTRAAHIERRPPPPK